VVQLCAFIDVVRVVLISLLVALTAAVASAQSTVFVVRHAEKEVNGSDSKDPALSDAGRARAAALAQMLRDVPLSGIFASEFRRTQQTAQTIADAMGSKVTTVSAKETEQLVKQLGATRGHVLVVGHSNTLPEILTALGATERLRIDETEYDNLFIWTPATKQLLRLHYATAAANSQRD